MESNLNSFISFHTLKDMFSDDQQLYEEFLMICMSSISQNMDEITEAIKAHDFAVISRIRHSMKPTFQSLELNSLIHDFWSLEKTDSEWPEKASSLVPLLKMVNHHIQLELHSHH